MEREDYQKIQKKLGLYNCPICNNQVIYCCFEKISIFNQDNQPVSFSAESIPDKDYIEIECQNCGYVMKFNLKTLLK